jgi:hypothetical protein
MFEPKNQIILNDFVDPSLVVHALGFNFCNFNHTFWNSLGLTHHSRGGHPWCVCVELIDPLGMHLLRFIHDNQHTKRRDAFLSPLILIVCEINITWKQLHALSLVTLKPSS